MKTMKKLSVIIRCFLLFMTIMITTGSMTAEAASPKLNVKSKTIYVGRSYQLKVKNTNKKVKWSSSDKAIATVSSKGIVKGKKAGKVTITASVAKKKLTCNVTVKNNVSVNKTTITLKQGKSTKVTVSTKKSVGTIWYNIKDTNVVSCKWGNWKGRKIPLTITAKNPGTTTVTITNEYSKEKVKIKVKVPQVWDSVEVVIPDTIGEQGCEENRMKILDYSFYNPYSWSSSYYMNVKFKMVEYGKTGRSNWGEDVYFYDANGNILDKRQLYAGSLALNKTFTDELMVPKNTAKIEFMEYPNVVNVTSVSLPSSKTIQIGDTVKLTATISPYGAADSSDIVWTSSDPSVATVKDGVVTGISEGDVYITASVGGQEDWCHVYVDAKAESNTPVNNYQILKNYLLTKGYTNTKGNKVISDKYTSSSQIYQYGIVYDAASDKYSFVWTTQSINGKTKTSMSMDIENPSNLILRPNYIYLYSNTVGFDATATISAATYDGKQNVYFTINDSVGGVSASDKQTLANVSLQTAFAMWDTLLYKNVGIELQDLGFVNYNH